MAWVRPTSHTANGWTNPENAYDGNMGTSADNTTPRNGWTNYLEMYLTAIECSEIRIYTSRQNAQVTTMEFDIRQNSTWTNVYSGEPADGGSSVSVPIDPVQTVDAIRVRFYGTQTRDCHIHDTELFEVEPAVDITITVPLATGSGEGLAPAVIATTDANISVPLATADASVLTPVVTTIQNISASVPLATADASGLAPVVSAGVNVTVASPVATATAEGLDPTVTGELNAITPAPVATSVGEVLVPTIMAEEGLGYKVERRVGEGSWEHLVWLDSKEDFPYDDPGPFIDETWYHYRTKKVTAGDESNWSNTASVLYSSIATHINIPVPLPSTVSGAALTPTVAVTTNDTVLAPVATAETETLTPNLSTGVTLQAPCGTADAVSLNPIVSTKVNVTTAIPVALGDGEGLAPTVKYGATAGVSLATAEGESLVPSAQTTKNVTIQPPVVEADSQPSVPSVETTKNVTVGPSVASGDVGGLAPGVLLGEAEVVVVPQAAASAEALVPELPVVAFRYYFEYREQGETLWDSTGKVLSDGPEFEYPIMQLTSDTVYEYRVVVEHAGQIYYGDTYLFKTELAEGYVTIFVPCTDSYNAPRVPSLKIHGVIEAPLANSEAEAFGSSTITTKSVTISTPIAQADSEGLVSSVISTISLTISTFLAEASAGALNPIIVEEGNVTIQPLVTQITAEAITPALSAEAFISIPLATSDAQALVSGIEAIKNVTIQSPVIEATSEGLIPVVAAQRQVVVQLLVAGVTGEGLTPQVYATETGDVLVPLASGTSEALVPSVTSVVAFKYHFEYRMLGEDVWTSTPEVVSDGPWFEHPITSLHYETVYEFRVVLEYEGQTYYGDTYLLETEMHEGYVYISVPTATARQMHYIPPRCIIDPNIPEVPLATGEAEALEPSWALGMEVKPPLSKAEGEALVPGVSVETSAIVEASLATGDVEALAPTVVVFSTIIVTIPISNVEAKPYVPAVTAIFTYIFGQFYSVEVPEEFYFVDIAEEFTVREVDEEFEMKDVDEEFFFREVDK